MAAEIWSLERCRIKFGVCFNEAAANGRGNLEECGRLETGALALQ